MLRTVNSRSLVGALLPQPNIAKLQFWIDLPYAILQLIRTSAPTTIRLGRILCRVFTAKKILVPTKKIILFVFGSRTIFLQTIKNDPPVALWDAKEPAEDF